MPICDLIKNQDTYHADANQTVLNVAKAMVARNIGAVPVLRDGSLVGISVTPQQDLQTCMLLMRRHGFRHLPVCEGKQLRGVISLRDLLLHDLHEKDDEVRMMRAYIQASPEL